MANKMISEDDLRDDFLSAMIRSDMPLKAPEGFLDGIMNRLEPLKAPIAIKPYRPPVWLKWGIPGLIGSLLIVILIWGPRQVPAGESRTFSVANDAFDQLNAWFSGFKINFQFPELNVSSTVTWIILGAIALSWGFLLLSRYLDKKYR